MAQTKDVQKAAAAKPKPDKITWTEQRKWRDGTPARLEGANSAYYLARKIVATRPRTAMVEIDGPAGFRLWINGELAQTSAPPPPPAPAKPADAKPAAPANSPDAKTDEKADDEKKEPVLPEINDTTFDTSMGRAQSNPAKKFRIGLRQGDNEIVVKVVYGGDASPSPRRALPPGAEMGPGGPGGGPKGGGAFTFTITPEGDDVVNHEVATALRLEAEKPAAGPSAGAVASTSKPTASPSKISSADASSAGDATKPAVNPEPLSKVSKVGEKSAPSKPHEEENKLSPSERRKKVLREYYRSHIDPVGRLVALELAKLKLEETIIKQRLPQTLVMEELEKPRQAYIFQRGIYKNRGENVNAATPAVLPPMPTGAPRNRLGLAHWLVSKAHPLTARVLVNRVWQQYFGVGIVRTAEDFGIRAALPTNPELLDYLATEARRGQVGSEKTPPANRVVGDLSPDVDDIESQARSRPGKPPASPRSAAPPDRRDDSGQCAFRLGAPGRKAGRRECQAHAAQERLEHGRRLDGQRLSARPRRETVPACDLRLLEARLALSVHAQL